MKKTNEPKKRPRKKTATTLSAHRKPVIQVDKDFLRLYDSKKKVVYFIRGNKAVNYPFERRSRILYIGQTQRKGARPFESLIEHAPDLLKIHGMKTLEIVYLEAPGRQRVEEFGKKFERVCLHEFRAHFGDVPRRNQQGKKRIELTEDEKKLFRPKTLRDRLIQLSS